LHNGVRFKCNFHGGGWKWNVGGRREGRGELGVEMKKRRERVEVVLGIPGCQSYFTVLPAIILDVGH
jgi:hypothetical protein